MHTRIAASILWGMFAIATLGSCGHHVVSDVNGTMARNMGPTLQAPLHFVATALPSTFVPKAIMKDGQIPGNAGNFAAVYQHGKLRILGSYHGEQTFTTSVNSLGQAVGYAHNSQ